jgi:hypothetical protein
MTAFVVIARSASDAAIQQRTGVAISGLLPAALRSRSQ